MPIQTSIARPESCPVAVATVCTLAAACSEAAATAIGRYTDGFYNPLRRHSALDFTSPAQFEKTAAE